MTIIYKNNSHNKNVRIYRVKLKWKETSTIYIYIYNKLYTLDDHIQHSFCYRKSPNYVLYNSWYQFQENKYALHVLCFIVKNKQTIKKL